MKKVLMLAAVAAIFGISNRANAQASATANASAYVVTPISITKTTDMNFGNLAVSASTGGTVVLSTAGARTATGGVTLPSTTGTVTAATFTVAGEGSYTYNITLPSSAVTLSDGAGHSMTATTFTSDPTALAGALTAGTQTLYVGATLNVTAGQAAGSYTTATPFTVTVNYN